MLVSFILIFADTGMALANPCAKRSGLWQQFHYLSSAKLLKDLAGSVGDRLCSLYIVTLLQVMALEPVLGKLNWLKLGEATGTASFSICKVSLLVHFSLKSYRGPGGSQTIRWPLEQRNQCPGCHLNETLQSTGLPD
jgi:hypothetical protein